MRGLLLGLFPTWWRRLHGADYRALLEQTPLTPGNVVGVLGAAARAHARPPSRLTPGGAGLLTIVTLVLLFCFFGGWSNIYRQASFDLEWRAVQVAVVGYAATGLLLARCGHRFVGMGTLAAAVFAYAWQMGLGVPGWRSAALPLQVCLLWFMAVSCWCAWWATFGDRNAPAITRAG